MKIIKGRDLKYEPNGTVYSDITDKYFDPNGVNGDMEINGLHILVGHDDKYNPIGEGFNGVFHMLDYVTCRGTKVEKYHPFALSNGCTDTAMCDFEEDEYVVVYTKEEIWSLINTLTWSLTIYGRNDI